MIKPDWKAGFSVGLRYWLFFMVFLFALGYDWILSIFIGMVGAIATSIISAWWYAKEDFNAPEKPEAPVKEEKPPTSEAPRPKARFYRYGFLSKKRLSTGSRRFGWLFRKRN
ncbi:MAG: hypothetical protein WCA35_02205 [Kovacikia sp.]